MGEFQVCNTNLNLELTPALKKTVKIENTLVVEKNFHDIMVATGCILPDVDQCDHPGGNRMGH